MIIVVGTPRSGTTFFTRWLANQNSNHTYLGEHFQPYHFQKNDSIEQRLQSINNNSLFKVHTGIELHKSVLNLIKQHPVHLVVRKNKMAQIISMGLASISNTWVTYDNQDKYKKGFYKKEWFNDITNRIDMLENIRPALNVVETHYYEEIDSYQNNGKLPCKQNKYTLEQSLDMFENKQQVLDWYNDWIR